MRTIPGRSRVRLKKKTRQVTLIHLANSVGSLMSYICMNATHLMKTDCEIETTAERFSDGSTSLVNGRTTNTGVKVGGGRARNTMGRGAMFCPHVEVV